MKKWICTMLCFLLLPAPCVRAADTVSLDSQVAEFMAQHALSTENFALMYFNTVTGESYEFNADTFFPAGNAWYLPLHMYYYEQEALGAFEPEEDFIDELEEEFTIGGLTLEQCRYQSLILGEASVAENMRDALGTHRQFKLLVNESYGRYPSDSLPDEYLTRNYFNAEILMNCLISFDARPEYFAGLAANLRLGQDRDGIAAYDGNYAVVHLLCEEDDTLCDLGIVSARQPYLLVCFLRNGSDEILAQVNALLCAYADSRADADSETSSGSLSTLPNATVGTEPPVSEAFPAETDTPSDALLWIILSLSAAGFFCVCAILISRLRRRRKKDSGD